MVLVSSCCFFQSLNGVDVSTWQGKMIKCQKQDGHVQGFSVLRSFSHIFSPQLANGHCFGGMLICVVCVFDRI